MSQVISLVEAWDVVALYNEEGDKISQIDMHYNTNMIWADFIQWIDDVVSAFGAELNILPGVDKGWMNDVFLMDMNMEFPSQISSIPFQPIKDEDDDILSTSNFTANLLEKYGTKASTPVLPHY